MEIVFRRKEDGPVQEQKTSLTEEERRAAKAETDLRMMIFFNYCKLFVIALVFIENHVWNWTTFDELGGVIGFIARPYVLIPIYLAAVVLTLLWRRSPVAVIVHLIFCIPLGLPFYVVCFASFMWLMFIFLFPLLFLLWCMTLRTIAMVWNHDWRKKKPAAEEPTPLQEADVQS